MYGTLHVVENLDDVPAELLAASSNQQSTGDVREFVRAWKVADLEGDLEHIGHGTDLERGKALFTTMACVKCHKMKGQGGDVGPDLVGISQKLGEGKIKPVDVLTEMVEPSKVIDDKYRTHVIALLSGKVVSGLIIEETDDQLTLRTNPLEAGGEEPLVIKTRRYRRTPSVPRLPHAPGPAQYHEPRGNPRPAGLRDARWGVNGIRNAEVGVMSGCHCWLGWPITSRTIRTWPEGPSQHNLGQRPRLGLHTSQTALKGRDSCVNGTDLA